MGERVMIDLNEENNLILYQARREQQRITDIQNQMQNTMLSQEKYIELSKELDVCNVYHLREAISRSLNI